MATSHAFEITFVDANEIYSIMTSIREMIKKSDVESSELANNSDTYKIIKSFSDIKVCQIILDNLSKPL
jgi:hypothetical protein